MARNVISDQSLRDEILRQLSTENYLNYEHPILGDISLEVGNITATDNQEALVEMALDRYELINAQQINEMAKVPSPLLILCGLIVAAIFLYFLRS